MKKILSLAVAFFCLFTFSANAQIVSSTSKLYKQTEKAPSSTVKFFHAGIGYNTFVGDDFDDVDSKFGFMAGYQFQKPMGSKGFFRGMDFSIGTRGWKYDKNGYESTLKAWNLQWSPFLFGYDIKPNNNIRIRPQLGIFVSADFAAKQTIKYAGKKDSENMLKDDDYIAADAGLHTGCDVIFHNRWLAGITMQRGFVSYDKDLDGSAFNFLFRGGIVLGK